MSHQTADDIRRLLDADAALFLECDACTGSTGTSIAPADAHLRGEQNLHTLRVSTARTDATDPDSMDALFDTLAHAIVNDDNEGHLHFECDGCGTENLTGTPTVGRLDDEERTRAIFLQGSTKTYPLPERRALRWRPPKFVCDTCNQSTEPDEMLREGPDAPEIGWTYAECPKCGEHYRPEYVGAATPLTP